MVITTIQSGIRQAVMGWRLALPLGVCVLLVGVAQAWPLLFVPEQLAASPLLADLARNNGDALAILLSSPDVLRALPLAGVWLGTLVIGALLTSLAYNFFSGGMLSALQGRPFWAGCRRYFWGFVGLTLILSVALLVLGGIALVVGVFVGPRLGVGLAFVGAQLLNLWGELGRAWATSNDRRNSLAMLSGALRVLRHKSGAALAVGLLGVALHVVLGLAYSGIAGLLIGSALVSIVLQQLVALVWQWIKLLRLSWALSMLNA